MSHAVSKAWEYNLEVVKKLGTITVGHLNKFDITGVVVVTTCIPQSKNVLRFDFLHKVHKTVGENVKLHPTRSTNNTTIQGGLPTVTLQYFSEKQS